ncbi:MAG: hypothetical protein DRQ78_03335 [Epsilonproteobacteria bacterium]|nr:MAG: hypothetical protein DRQ78_03335 [Campylobacterota bacterium]
MSTLAKEIEKHIKKLVHPLKENEALDEVLKRKLTKKELKLLKAWTEKLLDKDIQTQLQIDEERYRELSAKLIKKLNQERIKQAICI